MRFTVFTPTYNRAHTLPRVYDSLCRQTFQDFEWVVVDDGSTDQTAALLDEITARHHGFPIRVLTTPNGGKHRAINTGVGAARGELFFIVDSDDHLPDDSLAVVDAVERSIPAHRRARFAGVCGLRGYPDGRPIGTTFDGETLDITTLERDAHGIAGDKAEVFHTDIMRAYPFPEFPGEHFLPEAVVWDRIAHDSRRLRFFNKVVYTGDYREDGLTRRYRDLLHDNPRGHALFLVSAIALRRCRPGWRSASACCTSTTTRTNSPSRRSAATWTSAWPNSNAGDFCAGCVGCSHREGLDGFD